MANSVRPTMKDIHLPPAWCSGICRNAMNEICVEHCALKRDCSAFEPKPDLELSDMPRFPNTKSMSREEKFTSVTIYLSKVVDHLQGNEPEPGPTLSRASRSRVTKLLEERKIVAAVAEYFQDAQSDPVSAEVDKKVHPPPETTSNGSAASESSNG